MKSRLAVSMVFAALAGVCILAAGPWTGELPVVPAVGLPVALVVLLVTYPISLTRIPAWAWIPLTASMPVWAVAAMAALSGGNGGGTWGVLMFAAYVCVVALSFYGVILYIMRMVAHYKAQP